MHSNRKTRAAARRESHYQPSWIAALLALIAAMLLAWHGMARADGFEAPPSEETTQSDQPSTPPAVLPCTDQMDFSPDDNLPDPFDAVDVAWHPARVPLLPLLKATLDGGCGDLNSPKPI